MQYLVMRTTVNLDQDVYELASVYASAKGVTLGAALGELVRRSQSSSSTRSDMVIGATGLPFFPANGQVITPEMVKAAQEDELD